MTFLYSCSPFHTITQNLIFSRLGTSRSVNEVRLAFIRSNKQHIHIFRSVYILMLDTFTRSPPTI
jgi:hypothetical protein